MSKDGMKPRTRHLYEYGKLCGFELVGRDGHEHWLLRHPNGARYRLASTPGDKRGDRNAMADMRRLSGVTPTRPKAGRFRHAPRHPRFSMHAALAEKDNSKSGRYSTGALTVPRLGRIDLEALDLDRQIEQKRAEFERDRFPYVGQELKRLLALRDQRGGGDV